jgi:hypothetical protein
MRMTVIRGDLLLKASSETRQGTDMLLIHNHKDGHIQNKPHSMARTRCLRHGSLPPFSGHNNVLSSAMKIDAVGSSETLVPIYQPIRHHIFILIFTSAKTPNLVFIYDLLKDSASSSGYKSPLYHVLGWMVNNDFERMGKESVIA